MADDEKTLPDGPVGPPVPVKVLPDNPVGPPVHVGPTPDPLFSSKTDEYHAWVEQVGPDWVANLQVHVPGFEQRIVCIPVLGPREGKIVLEAIIHNMTLASLVVNCGKNKTLPPA